MKRLYLKTALPLLGAAAVGVILPTLMLLVRAWGVRIPQPRIEADFLAGLVWALLIAVSILIWPVPARDKPALLLIWGGKALVTLGFMLYYEANYSLDAYGYFLTADAPLVAPTSTGVDRGTENFYVIMWGIGRFVPNSYHALKVSFALFGLIGVYLVYRGAVAFWKREDTRLLLLLGFYPSILFWSSILGKDPLQLVGIGLYSYGVLKWRASGRAGYMLAVAAGMLLAAFIRAWFGVIMLAPLLIFGFWQIRGPARRIIFLGLSISLLVVSSQFFMDRLGIQGVAGLVERVDDLDRGWEGGSAQVRTVEIRSVGDMLAFAPAGIFTALFRPLPGEVNNPFGLLAGLENAALLILLGLGILRSRWADLREPVIQWAIIFLGTWAGAYGFVSYYNLGAAVRFKLQILPVLICLLLYLAQRSPAPEVRREFNGSS